MMRKHDLHVMIDYELSEHLVKLKQELGVRSISRLVTYIFRRCKPMLMKRYFEDKEQESCYELINADRSLARVSLHVYLKEEDYRWLKQNHQDLNFYSIAQIIRWIIRMGIALLKQGFIKANWQWKQIARIWEKKLQAMHRKMQKVIQLFPDYQFRPDEVGWVCIYNREFSPLRDIFMTS